jgi:hypothetical protein
MGVFLIPILFIAVGSVIGQQMIGMSYNMGFPQGDMKQQVENGSYVGFGIEGRQFMQSDISFGVSFNWNKFKSERSAGALNSNEERKIDTFPILLNLDYYLFDEETQVRPYFGLNGGTYFINNRAATSTGLVQQKSWHFGVAPEIGLLVHMFSDLDMMFMVRYNYAVKSGGSYDYEYWTIHITFVSVSIL